MARLKIKFHPLFWLFLILLLFSKNPFSIISFVLCVFLHELGHYFVSALLGYKLNKITFMPFGASLSGTENAFFSTKHETMVALAGPLVNLILLTFCLALFWCFPYFYIFLEDFYFANLITFIFNLLPVYPLDGGRVLYAFFKRKGNTKKAYKKTKIVGFVISMLLFVLFVITSFYSINYTLGVTSIFLIVGLFFEDKSSYYQINFNFVNKDKKLNEGLEVNSICVKKSVSLYKLLTKLSKFKYNLVNILNEENKIVKTITEGEINKLFLTYPLDSKLENLFVL